ncbi:hypothetical protein HK101_000851 [Irineochytrium annulatum]|nr:hypothetical protein HK101_000851 [Irineochytrium annulatum]
MELKYYSMLMMIILAVQVPLDCGIMTLSMMGTVAREGPRKYVTFCLQIFGLTIDGGTKAVNTENPGCEASLSYTTLTLFHMVVNWGFSALVLWFFVESFFFMGRGKKQKKHRNRNAIDRFMETWADRLDALCFYWTKKKLFFTDSQDVLRDIAGELGDLFQDFDWAPSDIVLGLILIKREQKRITEIRQARRIIIEQPRGFEIPAITKNEVLALEAISSDNVDRLSSAGAPYTDGASPVGPHISVVGATPLRQSIGSAQQAEAGGGMPTAGQDSPKSEHQGTGPMFGGLHGNSLQTFLKIPEPLREVPSVDERLAELARSSEVSCPSPEGGSLEAVGKGVIARRASSLPSKPGSTADSPAGGSVGADRVRLRPTSLLLPGNGSGPASLRTSISHQELPSPSMLGAPAVAGGAVGGAGGAAGDAFAAIPFVTVTTPSMPTLGGRTPRDSAAENSAFPPLPLIVTQQVMVLGRRLTEPIILPTVSVEMAAEEPPEPPRPPERKLSSSSLCGMARSPSTKEAGISSLSLNAPTGGLDTKDPRVSSSSLSVESRSPRVSTSSLSAAEPTDSRVSSNSLEAAPRFPGATTQRLSSASLNAAASPKPKSRTRRLSSLSLHSAASREISPTKDYRSLTSLKSNLSDVPPLKVTTTTGSLNALSSKTGTKRGPIEFITSPFVRSARLSTTIDGSPNGTSATSAAPTTQSAAPSSTKTPMSKFSPWTSRRGKAVRNHRTAGAAAKDKHTTGNISKEDIIDILHYARFAEVVYAPEEYNTLFGEKKWNMLRNSPVNQLFLSPYFIAFDPEEESVVISIRGTFSIEDVLVDLKFDLAEFEIPELIERGETETHWVHSGMLKTAKNIVDDIEANHPLNQLLYDQSSPYYECHLVVTGHSLGAGVAALVASLLRSKYPSVCCYAYEPPGCLLSARAAAHFEEFCTSVIMGDDIVPRIGKNSMELLKLDLARVIETCEVPKWRVFGSVLGGSSFVKNKEETQGLLHRRTPSGGLAKEDLELIRRNSKHLKKGHDLTMPGPNSTPMFVPGKVLHIEKIKKPPLSFNQAIGGALNRAAMATRDRFRDGAEEFKEIIMDGAGGLKDALTIRVDKNRTRGASVDNLESVFMGNRSRMQVNTNGAGPGPEERSSIVGGTVIGARSVMRSSTSDTQSPHTQDHATTGRRSVAAVSIHADPTVIPTNDGRETFREKRRRRIERRKRDREQRLGGGKSTADIEVGIVSFSEDDADDCDDPISPGSTAKGVYGRGARHSASGRRSHSAGPRRGDTVPASMSCNGISDIPNAELGRGATLQPRRSTSVRVNRMGSSNITGSAMGMGMMGGTTGRQSIGNAPPRTPIVIATANLAIPMASAINAKEDGSGSNPFFAKSTPTLTRPATLSTGSLLALGSPTRTIKMASPSAFSVAQTPVTSPVKLGHTRAKSFDQLSGETPNSPNAGSVFKKSGSLGKLVNAGSRPESMIILASGGDDARPFKSEEFKGHSAVPPGLGTPSKTTPASTTGSVDTPTMTSTPTSANTQNASSAPIVPVPSAPTLLPVRTRAASATPHDTSPSTSVTHSAKATSPPTVTHAATLPAQPPTPTKSPTRSPSAPAIAPMMSILIHRTPGSGPSASPTSPPNRVHYPDSPSTPPGHTPQSSHQPSPVSSTTVPAARSATSASVPTPSSTIAGRTPTSASVPTPNSTGAPGRSATSASAPTPSTTAGGPLLATPSTTHSAGLSPLSALTPTQLSQYAIKRGGVPTTTPGVRRTGKYHYIPRWAKREEFSEIVVSRTMVQDHFPFELLKEFEMSPVGSILGILEGNDN